MTKQAFSKSMWIVVFALLGVCGGFVLGQIYSVTSTAQPVVVPGTAAQSGGDELPIRTDGSSVFADVAAAVGPAVVFVRTERSPSADNAGGPQSFEFFRDFFPDTERENPHFRRNGGGSGFVIDSDGRILTNHHVIRDADRITVVVAEGEEEKEYEAEVVGFDPFTDIAIIQIDPPAGLRVVPLGDSDAIRVGDWVMAIGTPFGQLQGTATVGIVSAKGRDDLTIVGGDATYQNYIQTDASINFGNSGGPLVNVRGEAIGINTAINPTGQGIGFAIPINMARDIMADLIQNGRVRYGFLGIRLRELTKTMAEGLGVNVEHGILVDDVLAGTPAEEAGLQRGDVIVEYNGEDVRDDGRFRLKVGTTTPGTKIPVVVVRDGKRKDVSITLGERPEPESVAAADPAPEENAWLGIQVEDAGKQEVRRRFNIGRSQKGVVVVGVVAGSPAEEAGIHEGDVITEVYSREVTNLADYVDIAGKLKDREAPIAFLVKRGKSTSYIAVEPSGR
jgi:serine protease Do